MKNARSPPASPRSLMATDRRRRAGEGRHDHHALRRRRRARHRRARRLHAGAEAGRRRRRRDRGHHRGRPAEARGRGAARRQDDPVRQGRHPDRHHLLEPRAWPWSRPRCKQGKFYLSPNAGPSQLAGKGCDENYFNVAYQNDNLHEAAGEYANTLGYKKTFILAPNYPAGKDSLNGFKRFYKGELAGELYTKLGQTDFAAEIAQIKASGADSVFFFLPGGMGIAFVKQFASSETGIPMIGPGFSFEPGHPRRGRRGGARRAQHRPVVARPRQRGQQGLRRGLRGRVRPPALALRQPGLRHRQPDPLGARQGRRSPTPTPSARRSRRPTSPRSAATSSSAPTTTRSRTSTPARWSSATTASSPTGSSASRSRTTPTPTRPSARCEATRAGRPAPPAHD